MKLKILIRTILFVTVVCCVNVSCTCIKIQIIMTNFNVRSLQRVWRCRQTDLVLGKGGVKISTRNRPLSLRGIIC